jgi:hypothetical protein
MTGSNALINFLSMALESVIRWVPRSVEGNIRAGRMARPGGARSAHE